jgi:translation initiation factor IF-1
MHCVGTSQESHYVSVTETNRLMLFREIIAVYCENYMEHINTLCAECRDFIYKNSDSTSQETHYVSATETNRLMLFREELAVYCENHMEHINTLCGQNAEF